MKGLIFMLKSKQSQFRNPVGSGQRIVRPMTGHDVADWRSGPDDILIRLNVTGLCFSDIHLMQNDLGTPPMSAFGVRSPGHEGAGVVVKVGTNVKNFKLGDRAGIKPLLDTCGSCHLCWEDKETYCKGAVHTGLMMPGRFYRTSSAGVCNG